MLSTRVLYYPTIDIHDEDWLKTAYLFWDSISTIVPNSMVTCAYKNNTTRYLSEVGYIKPIVVNPNSAYLKPLIRIVKNISRTEVGLKFLTQKIPENIEANPYSDERSQFYLHHEKLPLEVQELLSDKIGRDGWVRVSENFADFYMMLLANKIANQKSLETLTPYIPYNEFYTNFNVNNYRQSFSSVNSHAQRIGRCMLTRLIIDGITINPLTSIDDLHSFKEKHYYELMRFRDGFSELAKMELPPDITIEGLQQMAKDIYENKFSTSYLELQKSLKGFGISFLLGGAGTLAFSGISTIFNQLLSGLSGPLQFAIGAGATFAYKCYNTIKDNQRVKNRHKMSYLLSIDREIGRVNSKY